MSGETVRFRPFHEVAADCVARWKDAHNPVARKLASVCEPVIRQAMMENDWDAAMATVAVVNGW